MNFNALKKLSFSIAFTTIAFVGLASAAGNTYTENEFLNNFSGKTKKVVMNKLGKPLKIQMAVKPTNAEKVTGKTFKTDKNSKPVKVEMWYYSGIVKYDPTHAYKEIEITFVNDNVANIAFFNNR
ncbi:MAG: hypothetical protein P8O76_08050 [Methylophilaceae bacterium]|nr:hypothetical protein [Methylophilaceae bacterium]MDG1820593.1 hypothetical protein [Methylophilaceae bacterium]